MSANDRNRITPDDPRLTAFAFGELEGEENSAVAAAVSKDPALQQVVHEIRQTGNDLVEALESEPLPETNSAPTFVPQAPVRRKIPFPFWLTAGSLAAASVAVMFVSNQNRTRTATLDALEKSRKEVASHEPDSSTMQDFQEATQLDDRVEEVFARRASPPSPTSGVRTRATAPANSGGFVETKTNPVSRIGLISDTTGHASLKRAILGGRLPPPDSIRVGELLAAFELNAGSRIPTVPSPLSAASEFSEAPWAPMHRLVFVTIEASERPPGAEPTKSANGMVARNVRAEIEFNPEWVRAYRLVSGDAAPGAVLPENFDILSEPDVQANQVYAALYEIIPTVEDSSPDSSPGSPAPRREVARINIGFSRPGDGTRDSRQFSLVDRGGSFAAASPDFKFAMAVTSFGMILQNSPYAGNSSMEDVEAWARMGTENDPDGEKAEFVRLIQEFRRLRTID